MKKQRSIAIIGTIGYGISTSIQASPDCVSEDGTLHDLKTVDDINNYVYERISMPDPIILSQPNDPKSYGQRLMGIGKKGRRR